MIKRIALAATIVLAAMTPALAHAATDAGHLGGYPCDVLDKMHSALAAIGEDGTRWDFLYLNGYTAGSFAYINGARVEIHVACD